MIFKRLKYWWFRRKNHYPCKEEIREIYGRTPLKSLKILSIALHYCEFPMTTVASIANEFKITRERVRQILMKMYYEDKKMVRNVRTSPKD